MPSRRCVLELALGYDSCPSLPTTLDPVAVWHSSWLMCVLMRLIVLFPLTTAGPLRAGRRRLHVHGHCRQPDLVRPRAQLPRVRSLVRLPLPLPFLSLSYSLVFSILGLVLCLAPRFVVLNRACTWGVALCSLLSGSQLCLSWLILCLASSLTHGVVWQAHGAGGRSRGLRCRRHQRTQSALLLSCFCRCVCLSPSLSGCVSAPLPCVLLALLACFVASVWSRGSLILHLIRQSDRRHDHVEHAERRLRREPLQRDAQRAHRQRPHAGICPPLNSVLDLSLHCRFTSMFDFTYQI